MTYKFTIWEKDDKKIERTLEEITRKEAEDKKLLGTAAGMDVGHCIYMGSRHSSEKSFIRTVKYYRYCEPDEDSEMSSRCAVTIAFYKDKEEKNE